MVEDILLDRLLKDLIILERTVQKLSKLLTIKNSKLNLLIIEMHNLKPCIRKLNHLTLDNRKT